MLEFQERGREVRADGRLQGLVRLESPQRIEEVQRQLRRVGGQMAFAVHVEVGVGPGIGIRCQSAEAGGDDDGLQQIGVGGTVRQAQLEAAGAGHAHHVGAVVARPRHRIGRPCRAGNGARGVDALVGVYRRVGECCDGRGVGHDATEKAAAACGKTKGHVVVGEGVFRAFAVPDRDVAVAAVARQLCERLGHEGGAQSVLFGNGLDHELEERMLVGRRQSIVELPVHLELAVGILVIVLVGLPAQLQHAVADFCDHVIAAHQRLLVVAGLVGGIEAVGDGIAVRGDQKELGFDAGLDAEACGGGLFRLPFQHHARRLLHRPAFHGAVGGDPRHVLLPRQLDDRGRIGHGQNVGMGGGEIEPGGETGEARAFLLHGGDGGGWHQLGALAAEQVGVADQEIANAALGGKSGKIGRHGAVPLCRLRTCEIWMEGFVF